QGGAGRGAGSGGGEDHGAGAQGAGNAGLYPAAVPGHAEGPDHGFRLREAVDLRTSRLRRSPTAPRADGSGSGREGRVGEAPAGEGVLAGEDVGGKIIWRGRPAGTPEGGTVIPTPCIISTGVLKPHQL
ncbi:hypothetical protein FKM82_027722, partial [Ascaphus truei]